jgi:hypothetical protein
MLKIYITKTKRFAGTNQTAMYRHAHNIYKIIVSKSKRKPYIRSAYFNNEKVFLDYFWGHIHTKNWNDRARRLAFYECALELIRYAKTQPTIEKNADTSDILYRFIGKTKMGEQFAVQIKEDVSRNEKHFVSVFPFP